MLIVVTFIPLAVIFFALLIFKIYLTFKTRWDKSYTCLVGKTVIVTGANTEIGYCTALDKAKRGARVLLACRNYATANSARTNIIAATGNPNVIVKLVDLSSFLSVRDFCRSINSTEKNLDVLINNAGGAGYGNTVTEDGLQLVWQNNHLSPFLLTHLLLDKLQSTPQSRVVIVASEAARLVTLTVKDVNAHMSGKFYFGEAKNYALTKAANIYFAREMAKRLDSLTPTVNALSPGPVATDFCRRLPTVVYKVVKVIFKIFYKTPEAGAQTTIYCAVSKNLDNVTGQLFEECQQVEMYRTCRDMDVARHIWEKCERLVDLKDNEKIGIC